MRGSDETSGSLFSYVDREARIPARHAPGSARAAGELLRVSW